MKRAGFIRKGLNVAVVAAMLVVSACSSASVPDARNVDIPSPTTAEARKKAINERPDSVMYLPLGEDVLVPEVAEDDPFPSEMVGPFELRGETLAGALQLILADYDISLAFETQEGLTRRITVANLRGDLGKVVHQVCSLADLYCSYEDGTIVIKDSQTFTVTLPPLGTGENSDYLDDVAAGLQAILDSGLSSGSTTSSGTSSAPIVDPTTRTIVYSATQRTADVATRYFQRLRANTAMIVFETYIWEVSLNSGNSTGINWSKIDTFGKFNASFGLDGSIAADFTNPISIGLPTTQSIDGAPSDVLEFLSQFGAVKTISQPQIAVLSGSEAELRVADTQNYVSQLATTLDNGQSTTSVNTDSVDTGFTLTIGSSWDKATVYANVNIEITDVKSIDDFTFTDTGDAGGETKVQLPQTSERQLTTQIRVRPGDSVLIAGLVRENDNFDTDGIGLMEPIIPQSRTARTDNLELVILLRPRVIVYTGSNDKRYVDFVMKKHKAFDQNSGISSSKENAKPVLKTPVDSVQEGVPDGFPAPLTSNPMSNGEIKAKPMTSPAEVTPVPIPLIKPTSAVEKPKDPVKVSTPKSPAPKSTSGEVKAVEATVKEVVKEKAVPAAPKPAEKSAQASVVKKDVKVNEVPKAVAEKSSSAKPIQKTAATTMSETSSKSPSNAVTVPGPQKKAATVPASAKIASATKTAPLKAAPATTSESVNTDPEWLEPSYESYDEMSGF